MRFTFYLVCLTICGLGTFILLQSCLFQKVPKDNQSGNILFSYPAQLFVGPDLGSNFLQRFSADATSRKNGLVFEKVDFI